MKVQGKKWYSKRSEWETPQDLFDQWDNEFKFNLDVSAIKENAKCKRFFSPDDDGLSKKWSGRVWMNPPYGREIRNWIRKAHNEIENCELIVALIPASTDTNWFHDYINGKAEIIFLKGRIRFSSEDRAPFPSILVIWRNLKR